VVLVLIAAAVLALRGGDDDGPHSLGTAVAGSGRLTEAIDAYGNTVDLRLSPTGKRLAGLAVRAGSSRRGLRPLRKGSLLRQRYVRGSNVVVTSGVVGGAKVEVTDAVAADSLGFVKRVEVRAEKGITPIGEIEPGPSGPRCRSARSRRRGKVTVELACSYSGAPPPSRSVVTGAIASDRRWLARARPLGASAPAWARKLYTRSLLVLRALTDRRTGAMVAGARDRWAHVWPRDAAAGVIAFANAGLESDARRAARFLARLDVAVGARFGGAGEPIDDGRPPAGDAEGWVRAALRTAGLPAPPRREPWQQRDDWWEEGERRDYLGNAIASDASPRLIRRRFGYRSWLARRADGGAPDASAAWAVAPFSRPGLTGLVRRSLDRIVTHQGRFGITPGTAWNGRDPWSAPTAWVAWAFARLGNQARADELLTALRRSATSAGTLPERVSRRSGAPRSTTPLAWSHAFAILALRERFGS
jgi:hypothetical protein